MTNGKDDDQVTRAVREIHPKGAAANQPSPGAETRILGRDKGGPGEEHSAPPTTILHHRGPAAGAEQPSPVKPAATSSEPVTGWLVAVAGPGRGRAVPIFEGMNSVGRDSGQRIPLNFGDGEISREGHFFVTYEPKKRTFHLSHGTKTNLVYLNTDVVLGPKLLTDGDVIEVGKTKLRFVPLCGPGFSWDDA
jgi:hypothetical protein